MKEIKKILIPTLGVAAAISLASCGISHTGEPNDGITKNEDGTYTVRVGNTNATALLPTVFGPMEYGLKAYAWYYGENVNNGKIKIDYKHLDDGYVPATRAAHTDTLLNKDKCFGIVYSYEDQGTLLESTNKVEVYTPLTKSYYMESGTSIASFPVQPIDYVEGEHLMATAFASTKKGGLGATKVGVIAGKSSTGNDEVEAMKAEAKKWGKTENKDYFIQRLDNVTGADPSAAVKSLKDSGCDVVLITDATYFFLTSIQQMATLNWNNVAVLASYKLSNSAYLSGAYGLGACNDGRRLLTPGWIAAGVQNADTYDEWAEYVEALTKFAVHNGDTLATVETETAKGTSGNPDVVKELVEKYDWAKNGVSAYFYDSYAMAGYIGMYVFAEGITNLYKENLLDTASTEDYTAVMEKYGMKIPMSTVEVSLKNGRRTGAEAFTLVEATEKNHTLGEPARTFKTTAELRK